MAIMRTTNVNVDRYIHELRGAYSGLRLHDPDYALRRDPNVYEKMERDPTIRQCLGDRLRAIAGGGWSVQPVRDPTEVEEEITGVIEACMAEIRQFQGSRQSLARFVFTGRTFGFVEGERLRRPHGDGAYRDWWMPTRIRHIDKRRVRVFRQDGRWITLLARITGEDSFPSWDNIELPIDRMIRPVYEDEEARLGHGRGLGDSVYWFFYAKWKLMEEGLQGAERWAQGLTIAKVDAAKIGATDQSSEQVRDAIVATLKKTRAHGIIAVGKDDEVDVKWPMGTGHKMIVDLLMFFDDRIRMLLSGSLLPTGGGSEKGSLARGEVEERTSEGITQLDSDVLDEAITEGLVSAVVMRNRSNLVDLGLGEARSPKFHSQDEKVEDHEKNATIIKTVLDSGMPVKKDEAYEKVGLTQPGAEDEVFEGRLPPEPGLGGGLEFKK